MRIRVRYYEPRLGVTIIRGVAFRAACSCGWQGPNRRERHAARLDKFEHEAHGCDERAD